MIEIKSYLQTRDGRLVEIGAASETLRDERYIDGALEMTVNGVRIIDVAMWDYIDQLWAYICTMAADLQATGEASTGFPDQALKLSFERQGRNRVLVTLTGTNVHRAASAAEDELVAALREAGSAFFTELARVLPHDGGSYAGALATLLGTSPPKT
ncbi:hypothetical protein [Actinomadura rugatobispora]|uniref:Uncharacterized protein n=1 Tax=Actinomadura rugatobispora TaxID=1994 RepID=A0ABW0ZYT2_9ACTN|nr:hypothetical protein GCM10010200_017090 [Actinomadura rugatobispora]